MLFGDQFAKEAKEREEQLRCLDKTSAEGRAKIFTVAALKLHAVGAASSKSARFQQLRKGSLSPISTQVRESSDSKKENYPQKGRGKNQ